MMTCAVFCLLLAIALTSCGSSYTERVTYSGYAVFRSRPQTSKQVEDLLLLLNKPTEGLDFWTVPSNVNSSVDILASPDEKDNLHRYLIDRGIPTRKIMHDVGKVIERTGIHHERTTTRSLNDTKQLTGGSTFYKNYQSYNAIEARIAQLAKDPMVSTEVIGYSTERRPIYLVKVSADPMKNRPVLFIDAGHHAREWISHMTGMYILESVIERKLLGRRETLDQTTVGEGAYRLQHVDSLLESLRRKFDIWFVPVVNPDGYEYSRTTNRLWRKNRSRKGFCTGVDLNRNYPFHWAESGASKFSCDETYAGPTALSEPESETLARTLMYNANRISMYLTLHAYSQVILVPFGHNRIKPDNYLDMERVAGVCMRELKAIRGTEYRFGTSAILLYPAAGGSDDFAYGMANIKHAYTIELPDTGERGFLLPPEEILPVGEETLAGIVAMALAI